MYNPRAVSVHSSATRAFIFGGPCVQPLPARVFNLSDIRRNTHHYVDMVFYNKILRAYVLIDLKMEELKIEHAGQMNAYLNYYKTEVNDEDDNPPIGIILCRTSKNIVAEYALGGLSNQVFASNYVYYIPDKEQLVNEVKYLLELEGDAE